MYKMRIQDTHQTRRYSKERTLLSLRKLPQQLYQQNVTMKHIESLDPKLHSCIRR